MDRWEQPSPADGQREVGDLPLTDRGDGISCIEPELLGCLHDRVADVLGVEVAADDVGLALSAAEEAAGLVGEVVGRACAGGVHLPFDVGVEQLVGVEFGAVVGCGVRWSWRHMLRCEIVEFFDGLPPL